MGSPLEDSRAGSVNSLQGKAPKSCWAGRVSGCTSSLWVGEEIYVGRLEGGEDVGGPISSEREAKGELHRVEMKYACGEKYCGACSYFNTCVWFL